MSEPKLPPEFVELCKAVTAKRPKMVIDHILKHGFITTQDLKDTYGYNHPPRAVRDVKEHGIPNDFYNMEYSEFLVDRRKKIAMLIKEMFSNI